MIIFTYLDIEDLYKIKNIPCVYIRRYVKHPFVWKRQITLYLLGDTDRNIRMLRYFPITNIKLYGNGLKDIHLKRIQYMPITHLSLIGNSITESGLQYLKMMPLTHLTLRGPLQCSGLKYIRHMDLHYLDLSYTRASNTCLKYICNMKNLQELHLGLTPITNLHHLNKMNIKILNLQFTCVNDNGLLNISDILSKGATDIDLSGTKITDKSVDIIHNMNLPNLVNFKTNDII